MQVKKQQLDIDMEQTGSNYEGVHQVSILSPCLFNLFAKYIMWNAGLDEAQTGMKNDWSIESLSIMSNSLRPHGLYSPWNSPGQKWSG